MSARRAWALPLVPLYAAVLAVKDALRRRGVLRMRALVWPVVSVGSLSAGGAGKTPVVMALALMLKERGWDVDVLSRGYGRRGRGVEQVEPDVEAAVQQFGDEPVLMAQRAGVPVWVGADRFVAGVMAEDVAAREADSSATLRNDNQKGESGQRFVHFLDDGFQHRQLARTVDIVLVTAEDLDDALLPAGNRRESFAALQRADVIVVREEESEAVTPRLEGLLREGTLVWTVRRRLRFPAPLFVFGAGLRPLAFCAIARPEGFAAMLLSAGCGVIDTFAFDDHHAYTAADIGRVIEVAKKLNASGLVTTEKDAVKLDTKLREMLTAVGPLVVAALDAEFVFPERVATTLEAALVRSLEEKLEAPSA